VREHGIFFILIKEQVPEKKNSVVLRIGMPIVCRKTRPPNITNMIAIQSLMVSVSDKNFVLDIPLAINSVIVLSLQIAPRKTLFKKDLFYERSRPGFLLPTPRMLIAKNAKDLV
jgi:hypothetical protein